MKVFGLLGRLLALVARPPAGEVVTTTAPGSLEPIGTAPEPAPAVRSKYQPHQGARERARRRRRGR
ncbi:MAG: hypothetical protein KBG29_01920 [Pseudomonadales bacterium]|nr:hypothetical protein [Pseudomonadales bacterium]